MNLLLNVNENLYSIKGVVDGEKKLQAAIDEAMYAGYKYPFANTTYYLFTAHSSWLMSPNVIYQREI